VIHRDLQRNLADVRLSEATIDATEEVVKARRLSPARAPEL
jgi:hypothetical protein